MRCWFNLNISLILLRIRFRETALPTRLVAMIPILGATLISRVKMASTRCFPVQDLPDALTRRNSEARLKRDDRENLKRIRPGRIIFSMPRCAARSVFLPRRGPDVSCLADAAESKSLFRLWFSSGRGSRTDACGCVLKVGRFFSWQLILEHRGSGRLIRGRQLSTAETAIRICASAGSGPAF
jgi:hypothetical protein